MHIKKVVGWVIKILLVTFSPLLTKESPLTSQNYTGPQTNTPSVPKSMKKTVLTRYFR